MSVQQSSYTLSCTGPCDQLQMAEKGSWNPVRCTALLFSQTALWCFSAKRNKDRNEYGFLLLFTRLLRFKFVFVSEFWFVAPVDEEHPPYLTSEYTLDEYIGCRMLSFVAFLFSTWCSSKKLWTLKFLFPLKDAGRTSTLFTSIKHSRSMNHRPIHPAHHCWLH